MDPNNDHLVAIMGVDPGTTTGVACAVLPYRKGSIWDGLAEGSWESYEVTGALSAQPWEIMGNYQEWREPYRHCHLVFEDFTVRLGKGAASRKELLDPVRVISGCEALALTRAGLRWAAISYQQPALKSFATDDRLRRHGLWVKGSDHRRDAVRHICRYYSDLIPKMAGS